MIELSFNPMNHTFTQSSFDTPCTKLDDGFSTGFVPVGEKDDPEIRKIVVLEDEKPLWFYCQQQMPMPHCQAGMVFGSAFSLSSLSLSLPDLETDAFLFISRSQPRRQVRRLPQERKEAARRHAQADCSSSSSTCSTLSGRLLTLLRPSCFSRARPRRSSTTRRLKFRCPSSVPRVEPKRPPPLHASSSLHLYHSVLAVSPSFARLFVRFFQDTCCRPSFLVPPCWAFRFAFA